MIDPKVEIMLRVAEMNMESCATGKFVTIEQFADGMMEVYKDLTAERNRYREELENIANADQSTWGEEMQEPIEFKRWAQSRARHALNREEEEGR